MKKYFMFKKIFYKEDTAMTDWQFIWYRILVGIGKEKYQFTKTDKLTTIPNLITALGIGLSMLYGLLILMRVLTHNPEIGKYFLAIVTLIIVSDILDGFIARATDTCSHLGETIDPLRDRMFGIMLLLDIVITDPRTIVLAALVVLIEYKLSRTNHFFGTEVHLFGKIRMAFHMGAGMIFVAGQNNPELIYNIFNIYLDIEPVYTLIIIAAGSVLAAIKYSQINRVLMQKTA